MGEHFFQDIRAGKIVIMSHCLLNANSKVAGIARYRGAYVELLDVLNRFDIGLIQLPCPELLYYGARRWWCDKKLFSNPGFKKFCYNLASPIVDQIGVYLEENFKVLCILGVDGSPTCGVNLISYAKSWGGCPKEVSYEKALTQGMGVWMEQIKLNIENNNMPQPPFYGIAENPKEKTDKEVIYDFEKYLKDRLEN